MIDQFPDTGRDFLFSSYFNMLFVIKVGSVEVEAASRKKAERKAILRLRNSPRIAEIVRHDPKIHGPADRLENGSAEHPTERIIVGDFTAEIIPCHFHHFSGMCRRKYGLHIERTTKSSPESWNGFLDEQDISTVLNLLVEGQERLQQRHDLFWW